MTQRSESASRPRMWACLVGAILASGLLGLVIAGAIVVAHPIASQDLSVGVVACTAETSSEVAVLELSMRALDEDIEEVEIQQLDSAEVAIGGVAGLPKGASLASLDAAAHTELRRVLDTRSRTIRVSQQPTYVVVEMWRDVEGANETVELMTAKWTTGEPVYTQDFEVNVEWNDAGCAAG